MKHYEIGDDVASKLREIGIDLKTASFLNTKTNKLHIHLKQIVHNILVKLGIPSEQIETSDLCTYDDEELFFSARRQSVHCGRMLAGIKLID